MVVICYRPPISLRVSGVGLGPCSPPPDGNPPQLDINGFSLWHYSSDKQAAAQAIAELAPTNDAAALRDRLPEAHAGRAADVPAPAPLLGLLPLSHPLPAPHAQPRI